MISGEVLLVASNPASQKIFPKLVRAFNDENVPSRLIGLHKQLNTPRNRNSLVNSDNAIRFAIPKSLRAPIKYAAWGLKYLLQFIINRPSAIIISDDRSMDRQASISWAAKIFDVPIILIPVAYWLNGKGLLTVRRDEKRKFVVAHEAKSKYVTWREADEIYRFYSAPHESIMLALFGRKLNPWWMGLGYSTHILCESHTQQTYLEEFGCDKPIGVAGNVQHDALFQGLTARDKDSSLSAVVIALPQFYEHGLWSLQQQTYYVEELLEVAVAKFGAVTVSLHPSMSHEDYSYLESEHVVISTRVSEDLIAEASVLISTYSSLVVWMKLCIGSVILLDPLNLDYPREHFPWDFRLKSLSDMAAIDLQFLGLEVERQGFRLANDFCFDGQAMKRTCAFVKEWANA